MDDDRTVSIAETLVDMNEVARLERQILEEEDGSCVRCGAVNWWHHGHKIEETQITQLITCQSCKTEYLEIWDLRSIEMKMLDGYPVPLHYGQEVQDSN